MYRRSMLNAVLCFCLLAVVCGCTTNGGKTTAQGNGAKSDKLAASSDPLSVRIPQAKISDEPLTKILRALEKVGGIQLVLSEEAQKMASTYKTSVDATNKPLGQLLGDLLHPAGLDYAWKTDHVQIVKGSA